MRACRSFLKNLVALGAFLLLAMSSAWAAEFRDKAERVFSPSVIGSVRESTTSLQIAFKIPVGDPDYFTSGDKANKVFAIESARLFRDLPNLQRLIFAIPNNGVLWVLDISRSDIERYYELRFSAMSGDPSVWRSQFLRNYDTEQSRADFVKFFVRS